MEGMFAGANKFNRDISKWYGFKKVMRLRKEYEQENNVEYDLVVNARLDHFWNKDINFSNFDTEKVHLSKFNDRSPLINL